MSNTICLKVDPKEISMRYIFKTCPVNTNVFVQGEDALPTSLKASTS
jgi:hypothetical protein